MKNSSENSSSKTVSAPKHHSEVESQELLEKKPAPKKIEFAAVRKAIGDSLAPEASPDLEKVRNELISDFLNQQLAEYKIKEDYNLLILFDEGIMVKGDADNIYSAAAKFAEKKPMLLSLHSSGGSIGAAYLIGKLCREYVDGKFVIVVPRQAKSAATLLCCAADEIHMGSLSELGPIDPQIDSLPALGLKSAVDHIADLVRQHPHAAEMFAKYLHLSVEPINLGYYERVAESAAQYAEILLKTHAATLEQEPAKIAHDLVYSYKDHGFVIDKSEAREIFGGNTIKTGTDEYRLGNSIYDVMKMIKDVADEAGYNFFFIGSCNSRPVFYKKAPLRKNT